MFLYISSMIPLNLWGSLSFLRDFLYLWSMHLLCENRKQTEMEKKQNNNSTYWKQTLAGTHIVSDTVAYRLPQRAWKGSKPDVRLRWNSFRHEQPTVGVLFSVLVWRWGLNPSASCFWRSIKGGEKDMKVRGRVMWGGGGADRDRHVTDHSVNMTKQKKFNQ